MATARCDRQLYAAAVTPLGADGSIDLERLARHCRRLLAGGCDGIVLFGTTGEGPSFSVEERQAALAGLIATGLAPEALMAATGCAALPDSRRLTSGALAEGCRNVLMMPPFFFREADDDGLYHAFAEVIEGARGDDLSLYLYNIPSMSGSVLGPDLIDRLRRGFPGVIAGVKDSSGDWRTSAELLERFPDLAIYLGHEPHLARALAAGARGAVSGLANGCPGLLRALLDGDRAAAARIDRLVDILLRYPVVPAIKALVAAATGEPAFRAVRPALRPLSEQDSAALIGAIDRALGADFLSGCFPRAA